ncbi:MAG TPA: hypothetical protein VG056_12380 [Pirellulales bacterium]|jgi:hypothetical protein|nr:hypothetical protein [Pirellulales bacterium]
MSRICFSVSMLIVSLAATAAAAMDIKGRVSAVDADKRTISIKADDTDQIFDISKDAKVYRHVGSGRKAGFDEAPGGLKAIAIGDDVTATTDFIDGEEQLIRIRIESSAKKKKHVGNDVLGKVAAIDVEKLTIMLTIDDIQRKFNLAKDCNVFKLFGNGSRAHFDLAPGGLNEIAVGTDVTLNLDTRDGKEQVAYIQIGPRSKKK